MAYFGVKKTFRHSRGVALRVPHAQELFSWRGRGSICARLVGDVAGSCQTPKTTPHAGLTLAEKICPAAKVRYVHHLMLIDRGLWRSFSVVEARSELDQLRSAADWGGVPPSGNRGTIAAAG